MSLTITSPSLRFPQLCACCAAASETERKVYHVASVERQGDKLQSKTWNFGIPYCRTCDAHASAANKFGAAWTLFSILTLGLGLLVAILYVRKVRLPKIQKTMCKAECTRPDPIPYSVKGETHTFGLTKQTFINEFLRLNPSAAPSAVRN